MFPIDRLSFIPQSQAETGTLLLRRASGGSRPVLMLTAEDRDGDQPFFIELGAGEGRFKITYATDSPWLAADEWELRVDLDSSYAATAEMPQLGDAFISAGAAGLMAGFNHREAYLSLAGALLPEPEWTRSFIGFKKWQIVYWPDAEGEPVSLVTYERE